MGTAFKTFAGLSFLIGGSSGIDSELLEREHELELQAVEFEFEGGEERGDGTIELVVELEEEEVISLVTSMEEDSEPLETENSFCCSSSALDAVSWEDNF